MAFDDKYETFALGDWSLQSGETIPNAHIAFKTFGHPSSPAIVFPTWYSALISHNFWLIGDDKHLNPNKYFIIIPALFGNGQSSSPSNTHIRPFPRVSFYDNVRAQYELVTKHFKIQHIRAVIGWSMGAGQSFQWAAQYPDFVDLIVPFCGSAKTSLHNKIFLEGIKSALLSAKRFKSSLSEAGGVAVDGGPYRQWTPDEREAGLKAFARVYAGWGFSQAFYRERLYEKDLGYKSLEDFMVNFWEGHFAPKDPDDLLAMLQTWQDGDISQQSPYNGNFELALKGIKAKALVLPGKTDLYFPPEDSEYEVANMLPGIGKLDVFPSIWGHWAGGPGDSKDDVKWLNDKMAKFFSEVPIGGT
ncbi:alpha/beta hydrolase fold family protein [Coccidioides posadasii C735 delta SOWgp]|uniref:Homoserine acetyltransferase family protein n=2 Tax=Coccidioides posadasii TaxID=199306 RepID=A0A0J6FHA1_COCPO|nr:alpha/beta hydrolase fold family protein [Coccidioides posadasii C735 delta SOWgp]EER26784.1 alpha/beta hydrolase fold family protein [Coccidioides posadasii C735 delta SOWgp]KMM72526.1 homoserine acetyltransferase family protein [Coccidioides posadasii RMSCC 3488]|eukprot:XP_003068929.1 alpha/beta hydrolase fold family protein [Coccidioides posadasii C735 delta SOWgp]